MKKIAKIVLTGGPCAGKTTGMSWIINNFTKIGYQVFVVDEAATRMIQGNAKPWEISPVNFQTALFQMQKASEKSYEELAKKSNFSKVLIVCDRGAMDSEGYLTKEQKEEWHEKTGKTATQMMEDYDAVFHLVTAAKGAEEYYTTANNSARTETAEEAREADDRVIEAWTGHPHLRIIDNSTDFEKKMQRLVTEISAFLGEPEPFEIERKFLILKPDLTFLESLPNCQRVEILQTYLNDDQENTETRIRQRGDGKTFIFTKTSKRKISEIKRVEVEKRLSAEEYCAELINLDPCRFPIRKTRYCLTWKNTYFELDVYPFWKDKAILEVELVTEEESFEIPDFIRVIKEVTEDPNYKNHNMALLRS